MTDEAVVADAGPLIALARIDALALVSQLFAPVWVTDQVLAECQAKPDRLDAVAIREALASGKLKRRRAPAYAPASQLGEGECSAIALARNLGVPLLVDDRLARRQARDAGVSIVGTLGILLAAKRAGLLDSVRPAIERLIRSGYYLSGEATAEALRLAGEGDPP